MKVSLQINHPHIPSDILINGSVSVFVQAPKLGLAGGAAFAFVRVVKILEQALENKALKSIRKRRHQWAGSIVAIFIGVGDI